MSDTPTPITFTANTYPTKELPPGRTITNVTFDEDEKKTQNFKVISLLFKLARDKKSSKLNILTEIRRPSR